LPACQQGLEFLACERLTQEIIHSGSQASGLRILEIVGGKGDDRQPLTAGQHLSDGAGGLKAVHDRHLAIHQHQIEGSVARRLDRFLAVLDNGDDAIERLQEAGSDLLIDRVVFSKQNIQSTRPFSKKKHSVNAARIRAKR